MKCPACQADVEDSADSCFHCGHVFRPQTQSLKKGSLIAGRYEVLAPLGKGGMGVVYKAKDHKLEETVAIKVLRPEVASDRDMERRFRTEIRLARRVRHRNVCGIHEYGEDGPLRYIAMEYVEGTDLRKILTDRGALPLDQAFEVCIRVAEGLQAIHEAGIIHRDLKTANLMVDGQGIVRLMDFGIAKQAGGEATLGATATGLIIGTPEYMSPEQARGEKLDFRSDIYSLGVLSYEIFTGQVPFRGETPIATIFKHLQQPPPLDGETVRGLPVELLGVLRVALAKTADERYSSAADFARALTEARDAAGVTPPSASVTPRPSALSAAGPLTPAAGLTPGTPLPAARPTTPGPLARSTASPAPMPTPRPVTPTPTPRPGATPTAKTPAPTLRPSTPPTVLAPTPGGREAPPTRAIAPAPPARRPGRSPALVAGAGLGLVAAAVGLVVLTSRGSKPEPTAPAPPSLASSPSATLAPAAGGALVVDALPWGEVVSIADARGARQPIGSGSHHTPLLVRLQPGDYTIEVRNPAFPKPVTLQATVAPGKVETRVAEFRRVEAAAYFRRAGLQP
ncbi:MAG TPA: protein kinase [Vicinamibacteria bacterium]|nr:protein kinase [Vicinamibacteria bacterium]